MADGLSQISRVFLRSESRDRQGRIERRVAEIAGPIRESPPHPFGDAVDRGRRPGTVLGEVVSLEDVEHLDERDSARTDGRHADHVIAAVQAGDRGPLLRSVVLEIGFGDEAAVRLHLLCEQPRGLSFVKAAGSILGDAFERVGEIGLAEDVTHLIGHALARELLDRGRVFLHLGQDALERSGEAVGHDEPFAGEDHGRFHQAPPWQLLRTYVHPCRVEPGHRSRDAHRHVRIVVKVGVVLAVLEEHRRVGRGRSGLTEVVRGRSPVQKADHHEPSASDVSGGRVNHREGEPSGDGRVDGVAAIPQNVGAHLRGDERLRGDHPVLGADGLRGPGHGRQGRDQQHERGQERGGT